VNSQNDGQPADGGDTLTMERRGDSQKIFWGETKEKEKKQRNREHDLTLFFVLLLALVSIQQISVGGPTYTILFAMLFVSPYLIFYSFFKLTDINGDPVRPLRSNAIIGPAIISLTIASCIFSAPMEGKIWIVGNRTTGPEGTIFAFPLFTNVKSIRRYQEIVMNVRGETLDNVVVSSQISTVVTCCERDIDVVGIYGKLRVDPNVAIKNYLTSMFNESFERSSKLVKESDINLSYRAMAKDITRKSIREQFALTWDGRFTVLDSD